MCTTRQEGWLVGLSCYRYGQYGGVTPGHHLAVWSHPYNGLVAGLRPELLKGQGREPGSPTLVHGP